MNERYGYYMKYSAQKERPLKRNLITHAHTNDITRSHNIISHCQKEVYTHVPMYKYAINVPMSTHSLRASSVGVPFMVLIIQSQLRRCSDYTNDGLPNRGSRQKLRARQKPSSCGDRLYILRFSLARI